jgi:coenzyme F420-reducing hydrogenase delta subunit
MERLSDQEIGKQRMLARIERAKSLGIDPDRLNFVREKSSLSQFIKTKAQADHLMKQIEDLKSK